MNFFLLKIHFFVVVVVEVSIDYTVSKLEYRYKKLSGFEETKQILTVPFTTLITGLIIFLFKIHTV